MQTALTITPRTVNQTRSLSLNGICPLLNNHQMWAMRRPQLPTGTWCTTNSTSSEMLIAIRIASCYDQTNWVATPAMTQCDAMKDFSVVEIESLKETVTPPEITHMKSTMKITNLYYMMHYHGVIGNRHTPLGTLLSALWNLCRLVIMPFCRTEPIPWSMALSKSKKGLVLVVRCLILALPTLLPCWVVGDCVIVGGAPPSPDHHQSSSSALPPPYVVPVLADFASWWGMGFGTRGLFVTIMPSCRRFSALGCLGTLGVSVAAVPPIIIVIQRFKLRCPIIFT